MRRFIHQKVKSRSGSAISFHRCPQCTVGAETYLIRASANHSPLVFCSVYPNSLRNSTNTTAAMGLPHNCMRRACQCSFTPQFFGGGKSDVDMQCKVFVRHASSRKAPPRAKRTTLLAVMGDWRVGYGFLSVDMSYLILQATQSTS